MRKRLLIFSFGLMMMAVTAAYASPMVMAMEMGVAEQIEPERNINIYVEANIVEVTGAEGATLEVISLTGRQVAQFRIDSPAKRVTLDIPKGCYILKVGKVVRKVTVR